jgi:hypothetical protein
MDHSINLWNFKPRMALPNRKTPGMMILFLSAGAWSGILLHLMVTMA